MTFVDQLDTAPVGVPDGWFDRFVFNVHPPAAVTPTLHVGFGVYPPRDVADGFVLAVTDTEQRNHRYSSVLSDVVTPADESGGALDAFRWRTVTPMERWAISAGENPSGVAFDLTWAARTPAWHGVVSVGDGASSTAAFDHLFQSGTYSGWIAVDGERTEVDGWLGARDRSRGVRTMRGGQGLHLWVLAHFPDRTLGFLLVEDRAGGLILVEGGVLTTGGEVHQVVDVRHELVFDDLYDLDAARFVVTSDRGDVYPVTADPSARGGWMAGGGYGGHHGTDQGRGFVADDVWPLDGSVGPRTLDTALTDRTALFDWQGTPGVGILEFARTRSPRYEYRPTLHELP